MEQPDDVKEQTLAGRRALKAKSRSREARSVLGPAEIGAAAGDENGCCGKRDRRAGRSAEGESERGGAVAMAIGGLGCAIGDLAGLGNGALDGVEVFANVAADWDAN